jgi:hypothetical protein
MYVQDDELLSLPDNDAILKYMAERYEEVEMDGSTVDDVHLNPNGWEHMKKKMHRKGALDVNTIRELLKNGIVGHLWTATLYVSKGIPDGCLYVYDDEILSKT